MHKQDARSRRNDTATESALDPSRSSMSWGMCSADAARQCEPVWPEENRGKCFGIAALAGGGAEGRGSRRFSGAPYGFALACLSGSKALIGALAVQQGKQRAHAVEVVEHVQQPRLPGSCEPRIA